MHSEFSNVRPKVFAASGPLLRQKDLRRVFQCLTKRTCGAFSNVRPARKIRGELANVKPGSCVVSLPMLGQQDSGRAFQC